VPKVFLIVPVLPKGCPLLLEWRWLVVISVLDHVLGLENALKAGWCLATYLGSSEQQRQQQLGPDSEGASGQKGDLKIEVVDRAICSQQFWGTCHMIYSLDRTIKDLESWCKGCPCHAHLSDTATSAWLVRSAYLHELGESSSSSYSSCPASGCRAPELAGGKITREFHRFAASRYGILLAHLHHLPGEVSMTILSAHLSVPLPSKVVFLLTAETFTRARTCSLFKQLT
jgi:hypothetical protein